MSLLFCKIIVWWVLLIMAAHKGWGLDFKIEGKWEGEVEARGNIEVEAKVESEAYKHLW